MPSHCKKTYTLRAEQYKQLTAAVPAHARDLVQTRWEYLQRTGASDAELIAMVAGSVSSSMAQWAAAVIHSRMLQHEAATTYRCHPLVPQQQLTAPGMGGSVKRVVLVIFCLWPSPQVLIADDYSVLSEDLDDAKRGHDSAQSKAETWIKSLAVPAAPFVVGEVAHEGSYTSAYIPVAAPIPQLSAWAPPTHMQWIAPQQCTGILQLVVTTTIAKTETFVRMTPSLGLPTENIRWGALAPSTVASQPAAPDLDSTPFTSALHKAETANQALRQALMSTPYATAISQQVAAMRSWSAADLDVHSMLSTWVDRVVPQPLEDVPDSFFSTHAETFSTEALALTPFVSFCDPDVTVWMPLPPNQVATPGFDPDTKADLYHDFAWVSRTYKGFEYRQQATLASYAELGEAGVRQCNKVVVIPESARVPGAQGRVFHTHTPKPTLVDFHAPLDTDLNLPFIAHLVGITPPKNKAAPLTHTEHVTYRDLELISDLFLGARSKAPMPMHSVFCPHGESLRLNLAAIEDQALDLQHRGYATLHTSIPYSPCRYVSNGTTERKDDPSRPRLTDNKSAPLKPFKDADGVWVTSQNEAYRQHQSPSDAQAAPQTSLPADPKEKKPALHHIAQDAMTLRHLADNIDEPVYICKFDMASFFDQLPVPHHERHLNLRMLRPQHLFQSASVEQWHSNATHMAHKRMGFGGTRNSNIGQRFANFIVFVVSYFMDILEAPDHASATGYKAEWLQNRKQLNAGHLYRQDKVYAAHMYTDDLVGLVVSIRTAMNFLVAVYLMSQQMNVLLAGAHKMAIGTGLRALGGTILVMLGVVAIPAHKRLHAAHQLRLVIAGECTFETYEKLLGLLVHCWILALMKPTMLDDMYKPLAYMRLSKQGKQNKLTPARHPYLHDTWRQWLHTLMTTSAAKFSAVMGTRHTAIIDCATIHMYGDAYRNATPTTVEAGIGGFLEGAWWHHNVDAEDAAVLDITKLEALVIPCNFIMFNSRLPAGDELAHSQIAVHGDGLASIRNMPKARVKNSEMRVIKDATEALPQFQCRQQNVVVAHTFGLGNVADAPSRNMERSVIDTCNAIGIRPRRLHTQLSVHAMVKLAAQRIRQLTPEERSTAPGFKCNIAGDGPNTVDCTRSPPKRRKIEAQPNVPASPLSPKRQHQPITAQHAPAMDLPVFRSPAKHASPPDTKVTATRSPPATTRRSRPAVQVASACKSLHTHHNSLYQTLRTENTSSLSDLIVTAYSAESPFAIQPNDMVAFEHLLDTMYDNIQEGVPDSTESHERSALNRYWVPFCRDMGMHSKRPPHAALNPQQKRAEHNMRAIFLPWTHARMRGVKQVKASPHSVMSVLRHVINWLDRENDEKTCSNKPKSVLKGMLTLHVAEYGPLLPDQSLAPPQKVIAALLSIPSGTKLGTYTLHWDDASMIDFKAMYEVSLQSGVRLDECSVGIKKKFDKRKMSRRSLMWRINGEIIVSPSAQQLLSLCERRGDGAILLPACSKMDAWGNKHGHKAMFFPFHTGHIWNAATSLRAMELDRPIVSPEERALTPLFRLADGTAFPATRVRTLLYYMYRHSSVRAVTPKEHISDKGAPKYSFHSGRKLFATSLAKAGADRTRIQSMARWVTDESVDMYDQMSLEDSGKYVTAAYTNCPTSITPRLLAKMKDIPIDNNDSYVAWAQECHVDLSSFTPDW